MEQEAWPTPQDPSREPLPRVEDLPVAEQGYEQESVKAAFDSFYRHAAQIDAALRTLEAVDSFHRQAAALRGDLRALRAAGWTQQSWTAPPTYGYGYGLRAPRDGSAPLLLYGYGSYGISVPVNFSSNRLSLLNRGVIYAIAHVRGGGELGKPWHDAARLHNKRNTFTDFIATAEHLVAAGYTNSKKLIIEGGSAGGLLMGAVTNLRPDLFHAVISHVPFVDVLNTMLDPLLPLTVGEYEEWGNPHIAEDYFYMKSYCPYTNLERKAYPAILVKTGLNDSQVMYWEPAKYVARLRVLKTDAKALLFKINMGAGHGGASGRYDYLREIALDYAFLLREIGIHE